MSRVVYRRAVSRGLDKLMEGPVRKNGLGGS